MGSLEFLNTTPTIPASVYDNLPPFLKEISEKFDDQRSKDVVLTGCLVALSGCFTSIKGQYGRDKLAPNLFGFIVAPPASGKGDMKYCPRLGNIIQKNYIEANAKAKAEYEEKMNLWRDEEITEKPIKPKYPVLFIPGNSSAAAIYWHLQESDGKALICETEADSLSGAIKQDWGSFSHILRGVFQHEPISICRKGDGTYIRIEQPQVSVLLTGTPDQVSRLIGSTADGLCSRFLFYCYNRGLNWIDQTPCEECVDYAVYFEGLGKRVATIKRLLDDMKCTFSLTKEQFKMLNNNFETKLNVLRIFDEKDAASTVYRLAVIAFRIAMIMSVLRNESTLNVSPALGCSDEDFNSVLLLSDVYFEHSMAMYSLLSRHSRGEISPQIRQFYSLLPDREKFTRKRANEIRQSIGISERSVGNYLDKLVAKGFLTNPEHGSYQKAED